MNDTTKQIAEVFEDDLVALYHTSPSYEMFYSDLKDHVKGELWEWSRGVLVHEDIIENLILNCDFGDLADYIEGVARSRE